MSTTSRYAGTTTRIPSDLGEPLSTPPKWGPSRTSTFPLDQARCVNTADSDAMEWVPDVEDTIVPVQMRRLCRTCPVRAACLEWATSTNSSGYYAATTTQDRTELHKRGTVTTESADQIQHAHYAATFRYHAEGEGSRRYYRRGCRCLQCRRANANRPHSTGERRH